MKKTLLILTLLLCRSVFAALPSTAQWDVRTTGNDTNGGCFDPAVASPGTDYSQQSSAQVAFTDLVIGATTTQLTSSANPFTSASVGNCINITAGTGFTVGRYNVRSVSAGVATMDRAVGTAASTGGVGNLGGSMASPVTAMISIVSNNTVWVKAGTYTITAGILNTSAASFSLVGYSAAHGDNLSGASITTATNSITMITAQGSTTHAWIHNLALSSTAATRGPGFFNNTTTLDLVISNCTMTGFSTAVSVDAHQFTSVKIFNTLITASTGPGVSVAAASIGPPLIISNSVISSNGGDGITTSVNSNVVISRSLIVNNTGRGMVTATVGTVEIFDSVFANNSGDGLNLGNTSNWFTIPFALAVQNSIFYGNGGAGINTGFAPVPSVANLYMRNNAYGNNTSGNRINVPAGVGDVTLTANPFTNSGSGDYSLNATAGGGAALKGTGFPGIFPNGTTTGHLDFGAVQSAGGGTTILNNFGQSN